MICHSRPFDGVNRDAELHGIVPGGCDRPLGPPMIFGPHDKCGRENCWVCNPRQPEARTPRPPLVYISGPLTTGMLTANVRRALDIGKALIERGFCVIVPHEKLLTEILHPMSYDEWLAYDFRIILCCDAVYRFEGASHGGDAEVRFAKENGIPVYFDLDLLISDQKLRNPVPR